MPEKYLVHYGIKGMKWGKRRFQNKDGSLTPAGIRRYSEGGGDDNAAGSGPSYMAVSRNGFRSSVRGNGNSRSVSRTRSDYLKDKYLSEGSEGLRDWRTDARFTSNPRNRTYGQDHYSINYQRVSDAKNGQSSDYSRIRANKNDNKITDADEILDRQDKNFMSSTVKKQQSNRPRQAPGSENVHNTADPRGIQYRNNPQRYGTFERGTHHGSYRDAVDHDRRGRYERDFESERKRGLSSSKSGRAEDLKREEEQWATSYNVNRLPFTPHTDGNKVVGAGGHLYRDTVTGKQIIVPYGNNDRDNSGSSSENNPARYGNFEQQKRDAARASKSKAGTKKSSLTTKAKQTISQATQQASQSVQKASDWLKKLFGKK